MSTLAIYERLQAQGKIGPRDELGHTRPYQEFPKAVRDSSGASVIVHTAREELAVAAKVSDISNAAADADPIIAERNRLAKENDELRARLLLLQQEEVKTISIVQSTTAAPAVFSPKAPEDELPAGAKLGTPVVKRIN